MTKLIVSLDNLDEGKIKELISLISEECSDFSQDIIFKFNDMLALYGFEGIEKMMCEIAPNASLMLDPKWHDIPQTLENYIRQLAQHPISKRTEYITLHASNGYEGCKAGVDKKNELGLKTKILAVTALTSLEEK